MITTVLRASKLQIFDKQNFEHSTIAGKKNRRGKKNKIDWYLLILAS